MLLPLQRDGDVGKLLKGNDDFGYMYIAERDEPVWKSLNVSEGGSFAEYVYGATKWRLSQ